MFIYIQEHWLAQHEAEAIISKDFPNYTFMTTSSDMFIPTEERILENGPIWHGTALGWENSINPNINKLPVLNERYCGVKYTDDKSDMSLLTYTAYLPTSGDDDCFLEIITQLSMDISMNRKAKDALIIGLDSNQSIKSSRRRSEAMSEFMSKFSLTSILKNETPTFHHQNQTSESQIDHILYSIPNSAANVSLQKHLCLLEHPHNLSSHDVLIGKLYFPRIEVHMTETDYSDTYSQFTVAKPIWDEAGLDRYRDDTFHILKYLTEEFTEAEHIPILTELVAKGLTLSAENNFSTRAPKKNSSSQSKPKFSEAHRSAYLNHAKVCHEWRLNGRPSDPNHPAKKAKLESQRNLQRIARDEEKVKAKELDESLMNSYSMNINDLFKKLKAYRGEHSKNTTDIPFIETLNGTYSGSNVLEGFRSNTETLCSITSENHRSNFSKLCQIDNMVIIDLSKDDDINIIPDMSLYELKDIVFKRLKPNKACDIFKLTTEHLRYCGDDTLSLILLVINAIIRNLNYMSTSQLNTAVASVIHKGKGKAITHHKSYRQVRVTPLIGRIIDEYLRPNVINAAKSIHNSSQYGFTTGITYMMAALQRHEAEKFCIDQKKTFFGCSLDGESAFEVVDRSIQLRELYCAGLKGQYWLADNYSYQNTQTRIKMNGQMSNSFTEQTGVKQGNIKSSDHYKIYITPLLDTADASNLGIWIGNTNISHSACADDEYLISDSQTKLQALIDIAQFYGEMYHVTYGASKTKVTVVGSNIDMNYFHELSPWKLNGQQVKVAENNEHLGQIVSGVDQEQKNIDIRICKGRNGLYSLLGPAFQHKSLLNPKLKHHLYQTYISPILRSGLSSFALRSSQLKSVTIFHRKVLRGILAFSKSSSIPALHFLLSEIPIEGQVHKDIFSLFYSVWSNPSSKVYQIIKYLLETAEASSRTWAIHLKFLSEKYGLEDPLNCLKKDPPSKSIYKETIRTKITAYYELELRESAKTNSRMQYFNVNLLSLRGKPHYSLSNILTTQDVLKCRPHLKMLSGDYLTYEVKSKQSGGSCLCRCCESSLTESILHLITQCDAYKEIRTKIMKQFHDILNRTGFNFKEILDNNERLTQFILDPTSMNLPYRIHQNYPYLKDLLKLSRDYCFAINAIRTKILNQKTKKIQ